MNEQQTWRKLAEDARGGNLSDDTRLSFIARSLCDRARLLGSANVLLWGTVRLRVEHNNGHWRIALARADLPVSIPQRKLIAAAFGHPDLDWQGDRRHVPALNQWLFVVEAEWGEAKPQPEMSYIAKLQILISDVIQRWQRTGQRPPHPPSHIAAMQLVNGLECNWETGEFTQKGES